MSGDTYQIGNQLFVMLRAFLDSAGIDPKECRLVIETSDPAARSALVSSLQKWAPPVGEFGLRASSAQAGNYGGTWQGVRYDFTVRELAA